MVSSALLAAALAIAPLAAAQSSNSSSSSSGSTYGASLGACSGNVTLRQTGLASAGNQTLSQEETAYIMNRRSKTLLSSLKTWMGSNATQVYNGSLDTVEQLPTIALAISGGGDRAALYGAAFLNTFDGRNQSSVQKGTGGLMQASTYISALSGGSWMLSSWLFNEMPQAYDMVFGGNGAQGWLLANDLNSPGGTNSTLNKIFFENLLHDVATKKASAGGAFNVTFGDYWARALSYHFLTGTTNETFFSNTSAGNHAATLSLSQATSLASYQNFSFPYPIILGNVASPNPGSNITYAFEATVPLQNVVYEMSPNEFGSYDPELAAFWPMSSLGTRAMSGTPMNGQCASGFDNAGFMMGISSNLFVLYNVTQNAVWTNPLSPIYTAWTTINQTFYEQQPEQSMDISAVPNPFEGVNQGVFEDANQAELRMLDGGLNGAVDPLTPFTHPARKIDLIVVADAAADTDNNRPAGLSIVATETRAQILGNNTVSLPPLPMSNATFLDNNYGAYPIFFGCNGTAANISSPVNSSYPVLVYVPNYDFTGITNTSTGKVQYSDAESMAFLNSAVNITSSGRTGSSQDWATCLKCASVERMRGRTGTSRTATCNKCFDTYCWNEQQAASSSTGGGSNGSNGSGGSTSGSGTSSGGNSGSSGKSNAATGLKTPLAALATVLVSALAVLI